VIRETKRIKTLIKKTHNIKYLIDAYSGQDCYLISCGPSLSEHNLSVLKKKLQNKLVICVKQSYFLFDKVCDIHVSNFTNYMKTQHRGIKAIEIIGYLKHKRDHVNQIEQLERRGKVDLKFSIESGDKYKYSSSLAKEEPVLLNDMMQNFIKNKIAMNGPGIVYEICFPLAIMMGVRSLTTIGWDIGPLKAGDKYQHFYDKSQKFPKIKKHTQSKAKVNHLKIRHEAKVIAQGSKNYNDFLFKNGVELRILSKDNKADSSIKRITIEDL
jgi:hypothetical protein